MRIWVLTNEYEPNLIGGLGIVATRLSEALAARELSVSVFCKTAARKVRVAHRRGVKVTRLPRGSCYHSIPQQTFHAAPLMEWVRKKGLPGPDLVHVHSLQFLDVASMCKQTFDVPVAYTLHSLVAIEPKTLHKARMQYRQEQLMRLADCVLVPSRWQERLLHEHYPFTTAKTCMIPNGVTVAAQTHPAPRQHLLYVGRITPLKGIDPLLRAVARLQRHTPSVRLDVIGSGPKAYLAQMERLAREIGIERNVRWLGFQRPDALEELYGNYGAVVVPSRQESFGLVALEALAHRVPLIATRAGGLREFVSKETAEVIPHVTPQGIERAVRIFWQSPERTEARIEAGYRKAGKFSWNSMAARYQRLFDELLEAKGGET